MTDTSKETVDALLILADTAISDLEKRLGEHNIAAVIRDLRRALLSERDTAFNAGIEAAAQWHDGEYDLFMAEMALTRDSNPLYSRACLSNAATHRKDAAAIRALAKGEWRMISSASEQGATMAGDTAGATIHVVFDGAPSPDGPRFVEVETPDGASISVGEWVQRPDGLWNLVVPNVIHWMPIETAPSHTDVLISGGEVLDSWDYADWEPFTDVTIARLTDNGWLGDPNPDGYQRWTEYRPTHWAPKPAPAAPAEVANEGD